MTKAQYKAGAGNQTVPATQGFLRNMKKAVLLELERENLLSQSNLERCLRILYKGENR